MKQGIRNGHNREAKKKRDTAINEGKLRGTQWVNRGRKYIDQHSSITMQYQW